jgi:chromosome segregation ATPase
MTPEQLAAARLRERAEMVDRFLADNEGERDGWLSSMPVEAMKRDAEEFRSAADLLYAQAEEIARLKASATLNESPMEMVHVDEHRAIIDERDALRSRLAEVEAERDAANEKAATYQRDWYAAKSEYGQARARVAKQLRDATAKLAESQAREARLRGALERIEHWCRGIGEYLFPFNRAREALNDAPASDALGAIRRLQRYLHGKAMTADEWDATRDALDRCFGEAPPS